MSQGRGIYMPPNPWEVERGDSQIHSRWHYFTVSSREQNKQTNKKGLCFKMAIATMAIS